MARTVRNPLELRTPVRTISSVMRNAPRQKFRPTELDFGDGRPERGGRGGRRDLTSVTRAPRETIAGRAPVSQGVSTPRGTTTAGAPVSRVQTSRAPAAKPAITSAIKKPAVAAKTTPAAKPAPTRTPVAAKTTTPKAPVAAKTTKPPVAAKTTTTKPTTTVKKPVVTPTKPVTKPTSNLTSTLKKAAVAAGTAALVNKAIGKTTTTGKTPVKTPPFVPPKTTGNVVTKPTNVVTKPTSVTTRPTNLPKMGGGTGVKPGGGTGIKPPTSVVKPPVTSKAATTTALTEEQIQAELDRVKASEEANVAPEGAVTNADGSYSVTENGMTTTYAADGSVIGMEAVTDTTVGGSGTDAVVAGDGTDTTTGLTRSLTGAGGTDTVVAGTGTDTSTMTDLGEGYFQDDSGNIYGADGNLMYTLGENGEYVDANDTTGATDTTDTTEDITTYTDPDTGLTWNMGADGEWSQEGFDASAEDITTYTDPDTGFTWNMGDDGQWTQEGFDDTGYDDTLGDDTDYSLDDDTDYSLNSDDDSEIIEDAKGGLIHGKRHFVTGGPTSFGYGDDEGYSDTNEEVQDFQNVDYNYGELDDPTMTGDLSLYSQNNPYRNTYLREGRGTGLDFEPEDDDEGIEYPYNPNRLDSVTNDAPSEWNDNDDGTFSRWEGDQYVTVDGETSTELSRTDSDGNLIDPSSVDRTPSTGITSTGGTGGERYRKDPPPPPPTGGLPNNSGLFDTIKDSLGTYAGSAAAGALLASLLESADNEGGGASESGIDMSQVGVLNPRTTDFGIGPARYVGYDEYGAQDEMPEMYGNELYQNLNAPGFNPVNEGDYADPEEVQYGNEEEMAEAPEEEMSEMADGGAAYQTHYTFGKSIDPLVNLGLKSGQPMKSGGLSHGGLPAFSNVPITQGRLNFRQGAAVHGPGDGQSDDIPAMLADGEYVIDADTVAQIGNGSTKAGAAALDKFRENIRSHKRSAPINKIPPKTKALTSYLKGAR